MSNSLNNEIKGISSLQGLKNALDILFCLAKADTPLTPLELSKSTSINRTTVYRILKTFGDYQLVEQEQEQKYRLGVGVWRLIQSGQKQHPVINVAMPVLTELWQLTEESVQLNLRFNGEVICMAGFESTQRLRVSPQIGDRWPLHITSRAKVILAHLPELERKKYLANPLAKITEQTETNPDVLDKICQQIREDGYCISQGEVVEDAASVAAPIFYNGQVVASIDVAGPLPRILEQINPKTVREAAARISALL